MGINWSLMVTVFIAIVLAEIVTKAIFNKGSTEMTSTAVSAEVHSPAEPVVVYKDPMDEYLSKHYPNAHR